MSAQREQLVDIKDGNLLIVGCQGSHSCGGRIRVPFDPPLSGACARQGERRMWTRESGETLDDITLSPSIEAGECGHFHVRGGKVVLA